MGNLIFLALLLFGIAAQAQEITVSGTIIDSNTKNTLPGVNISLKGTTNGTFTEEDGTFKLIAPSKQDTLVFSFVGYEKREIPIQGRSNLGDVTLTPRVFQGKEMVVVGYGTQQKEDVTTSISQVSGDEITERPSRNLTSSLQGKISGVTISDLGGEPGQADINVRIRGLTSLSGNTPLFIVDGVEQSYNDINPNNVKSITVLKDAASTAIYGSRAANGVVLITTKRGSKGDLQVSFNSNVGFQDLAIYPKHLGTEAYLREQNLAYENRGSDPMYTEDEIQKYVSGENRLKYPKPNDWFNVIVKNSAPVTRNTLTISGGGKLLKTYGSFSYYNQQGIYPNMNAQRYQLRVNNDIYLTDELTLKADIRLESKDRFMPNDPPGFGSLPLYRFMTHASQFAVPQYPDGTYGLSPQKVNVLAYSDLNVVGTNNVDRYLTTGNVEGIWDITQGLTFTSRAAIDLNRAKQTRNYPTFQIRDHANPDNILLNRQINSLEEYRSETIHTTWYSTLTYELDLQKHSLSLLGGYSQETNDYNNLRASGRNLYNNELRDLGQTESENRTINSLYQDWGLRSFFSRFKYNYNQRYLVQFNLRYDGSSRFPKGDRYTVFPSASVGWRLSNESFWDQLSSTINEFKIRASWGEAGNQNVGLYSYYDVLGVGHAYVFNNNPVIGVAQNNVTSRDLSWETTEQFDLGFDLSFLNNKYSAQFDWYQKNTKGILLSLPIPGTVGLNPAPTNAGKVRNTGWELQLSHQNIINEFSYSISFNLSNVHNEITDLTGTGPYLNGYKQNLVRKVGAPIDALWGYETDGLYTQKDIESGYPTLSPDAKPGDIKFVDRNNDGTINSKDKKVIGSGIPGMVFGANINLGWKNFNFFLDIQGVGKRDMMPTGAWIEGGSWAGFTLEKAGDYWTPDNMDSRFPRPQKFSNKNTHPSDWWVVDGSYIRLKNLQLGYSLPHSLMDKIGIKDIKVSVGGTNLYAISNLKSWGIDPEAPMGRIDYYPPLKTYNMGLNVKF